MRNTSYLLIMFQISYLTMMVLSFETQTEVSVAEESDLEDSFLNISTSLKNIKEKIAVITTLLPKAFPTNSSERTDVDQNFDVDVSHYNGTYDSIMEKVEKIKNKVKELKSTLRTLSTTLDSKFGAEK
uniref:Putative secreted protein n=1 Tax=Panstrongylus lignarius TaxID=156445 RepID=A0A224Y080_9HEMI